jgi:alginate O-acetyltransferase complex protein AlgI
MVFSSTAFLFLFLPLVLGVHFFAGESKRNGVLLVASLGYYAWGESRFLPLVLLSVSCNYLFGMLIGFVRNARARKLVVTLAAVGNVAVLIRYKYAAFFGEGLNELLRRFPKLHAPLLLEPIALPLGISFFTFHVLSYVVDVYRGQVKALRNLPLLCLYVLFFPQLVAGPIVRYHEIADQLTHRQITLEDLAVGIERFVIGFGKKLLIANVTGEIADGIFGLPPGELNASLAWLGICAYALQVYFDFSGYSDMAIGLARMFGFRFPENFNYPYIARSMTEFWQRWHLSLSRWFRDYVYIPLGGNRRGRLRTYTNLTLVFLLCGLWHGASWNFVLWGALHGTFLVIERAGFLRIIERAWSPLRHAYCGILILISWVPFRAPTLALSGAFLKAMLGHGTGNGVVYRALNYLDNEQLLALAVGVVGSTPLLPWLARRAPRRSLVGMTVCDLTKLAAMVAIALVAAMRLSSGTYNSFIYFRF